MEEESKKGGSNSCGMAITAPRHDDNEVRWSRLAEEHAGDVELDVEAGSSESV